MTRCCPCCPVLRGRSPKKIVLLLVGLDNAGKTTAARNLAGGTTYDIIPTVGFTSIKLKHRGMDINIYDLGGGSQIRAIWKSYFSDVHGVIFVVDASDASRLEECKHVLENLLRSERLAGKPVLVLANKQDKPGALDQVDLVEGLRLEPLVNEQKCLTLIEECSAGDHSLRNKIDSRLLNGYRWLVNQIANNYEELNMRVERDKKIDAEIFQAHRNELRQRLGAKENGLEPHLNGEVKNLPYRNNIIHVSPPPGVIVSPVSPVKAFGEPDSEENNVQNLTRHIREQLERQSIKDRHRMSLSKKNKIIPAQMSGMDKKYPEGERPRSEPNRFMLQDSSISSLRLDGKQTLPPIRRSSANFRPATSKSLGCEVRAWDLEKELEVINPLPNGKTYDSSEVRNFNDVQAA